MMKQCEIFIVWLYIVERERKEFSLTFSLNKYNYKKY